MVLFLYRDFSLMMRAAPKILKTKGRVHRFRREAPPSNPGSGTIVSRWPNLHRVEQTLSRRNRICKRRGAGLSVGFFFPENHLIPSPISVSVRFEGRRNVHYVGLGADRSPMRICVGIYCRNRRHSFNTLFSVSMENKCRRTGIGRMNPGVAGEGWTSPRCVGFTRFFFFRPELPAFLMRAFTAVPNSDQRT